MARSLLKREGQRGEHLQKQRSKLARTFREAYERDLAAEGLEKTIKPEETE